MWLFGLFVAVPLIEIALFVTVGGWLTLWPTLAIVLLTAVVGSLILRRQGARALAEVQASVSGLRDPMRPLAEGAMILVAGLLLLTPGFFTDALGFALLVPPVRRTLLAVLAARMSAQVVAMRRTSAYRGTAGAGAWPPNRPGDTIETEYHEVGEDVPLPQDSTDTGPRGASGWTRQPGRGA